jgi:hypothetical protein
MPQLWKGEAGNGFRVRYSGEREADLVFINERAFAVLEWAETGAAMVTVELDPAKLRPALAPGTFDYLEVLKDPR